MARVVTARAVALALVILAAAFAPAGCNRTAPQPGVQATVEPKTISVALWDLERFGDDAVGQRIQEELGIRLRVLPMDWDTYQEQARLWAATDSLPDVLATYTVEQDHLRLFSWADQGLIRPIPQRMIDARPRVRELFEDNEIERVVSRIRGEHLFIPRPFSLAGYYRFDQGRGAYYRRDWLAAVGMERPPRTVVEFRDMVCAFTFSDPDGNGVADTWGVSAATAPTTSFAWWGVVLDGWIEEDGRWIPGFLSRRNAEALAFWGGLYRDGVLDPRFAEDSVDQSIRKFSVGRHGVCFKNVDTYWVLRLVQDSFGRTLQSADDAEAALARIDVLPPLSTSPDVAPVWPAITESSGSEISAKVDNPTLERILDLFEWLASPEATRLLHYGIEGVDYAEGASGPRWMSPAATAPVTQIVRKYPSARIRSLLTWDADYWIEDAWTPEAVKELSERVRGQYNPIAHREDWAVRLSAEPPPGQQWPDVSHEFALMILRGDDAAAAFGAWRRRLLETGYTEVVERANRAATGGDR
jgi:ABC-type glycerol-3-phosphate transport system substrate-binding protein